MSRIAYAFLFLVVALLGDACRPGQRFTYKGRIYDGVTGEQVKTFTVTLQWGDTTINGLVKDGLFTITDVPVLTDYSVTITAPGYRPFLSENVGRGDVNTTTRTEGTAIFENYYAVLYPDIPSPAQQIQVFLDDSATRPNGTVRLHPTGVSNQVDYNAVAGYSWNPGAATPDVSSSRRLRNSLDAFIPSVTLPVTDGIIDVAEGVLTLGVGYDSDIYGVPGYALKSSVAVTGVFIAGTGTALIRLSRMAQDDSIPTAIFSSLQLPSVVDDGSFTVVFDRPIEFTPTVNLAIEQDDISDGLTTNGSPVPQLVNNGAPNQYGISVARSGNQVTIKWSGFAVNLVAPTTTQVAPSAVCYLQTSLADLFVRAVGGDGSQTALSTAIASLSLPATPIAGYYCVAFRAPQAPTP